MAGGNQLRKQSKIVKYKLEKDVIAMRNQNMSYQEIADTLNESGRLPDGEVLDRFVIMRFLEKVPEITKELVSNNQDRMMEAVNMTFDIVYETNDLYRRAKTILDNLEIQATDHQRPVNPYQFKAVASEMRELLTQMISIQKEINDYNNIKQFMEIILEVLHDEVPEKIPIIVERLKLGKGTQWFADMVAKRRL